MSQDTYNFWLPYKASFNVGLHVELDTQRPVIRLSTHNCEGPEWDYCDEDCKTDTDNPCGYGGTYQQLYLSQQDCKDLATFLLRISE